MKYGSTILFALFCMMMPPARAQFVQQGSKLVGTGAVGSVAQQGTSVSISADGNTAIEGGIGDLGGLGYLGAAWIYTRTGGVWTQEGGKLVGTGASGSPSVYQGIVSLSADGNTAIVGGFGDYRDGRPQRGSAWVYTRSGGVWTQEGSKIFGTGAEGLGELQGAAVALSADGNTALVGGPGDAHNGQVAAGAVWVFTRSGGVWTQEGTKLVGTGAVGGAFQGSAVSLSADGNTAIVGGYEDSSNAGAAWLYTRSGGVWTQQGSKLVGTGTTGYAEQGYSVALSGDGNTAIVGGRNDNNSGGRGAVWVYTRSGGVWTQQGSKLVGTGATGYPSQGSSVSLSASGDTAIVGGSGDNGGAGAFWVFTRGGGVWTQQGCKFVGTGAAGNAFQGVSVSLSTDGSTAIVGGSGDSSSAGAAWVFTAGAGPFFSVAPSGSSFGDVLVGSSKIDSVTVTNSGAGSSLSISSIVSNDSEFTIFPVGATIAPADSQKFYITFSPTSAGAKNGTINFIHNAQCSPGIVMVSGTGTQAIFSALPASITFGFVHKDSSKSDSILVTNTGNISLVIDSVRAVGGQFTVVPNGNWMLAPSVSKKYMVTFAPTTFGLQSGNITFWHNGQTLHDNVHVSGTGTQGVFSPSSPSISFGTIRVGSTRKDSMVVTNTGNLPLSITSVHADSTSYSATPASATISPSANKKFYVMFSPTSVGVKTGHIIFVHDAATSPDNLLVTGTGAEPMFSLSSTSINFGFVVLGTSDSVIVTNAGGWPLTISSISSDNPDFAVSPGSLSVPPVSSKTVHIVFNPSSPGTKLGHIIFVHDAVGSPDSVDLSATGSFISIANRYNNQWNLVSNPINSGNDSLKNLFQDAASKAYAYKSGTGYQSTSILTNGTGYWVKFASPETVQIFGGPIYLDTIDVSPSWNLIGSISFAVAVANIGSSPGPLVTSRYFGYSGSYIAKDSIEPGRAYWVKANQPGKLILASSPSIVPANRIRIELTSETPPPPPESEISNLKSELPDHFALEQNYPNPFNPATVIRYSLPVSGHVTLKIYNTLGQEIAVLLDETQAAGYQSIRWDAAVVPSGVYIYKLVAGSFVDVKKMILIK